MIRSIAAVGAGFLFIALLSIGADSVLRSLAPSAFDASGRTDSPAILLLVLAYVGVFAVSGCYLTARLAPNHPMRHALILGAVGLVFDVVGTVVLWNTAPAWYHLLALTLVMPYAWLGGHIRERQLRSASESTSAVAFS